MNPNRCSGPISRRSFLTMGTLGITGLSLGDVMRLRAAQGKRNAAPDTSVIFVWLAGGPPHLDMYDMKPDAPEEYRGPFKPIKTNVPGLDVCEHMPLHAKCADKFTVIRSIAHTFNDHGGGSKRVMTGRIPLTPTETVNDSPAVCTIVAKMREKYKLGLPNCVSVVDGGRSNVDTYAQGAAYLGRGYTPFMVDGDPSKPNFQVKNIGVSEEMALRLDDRFTLLRGIEGVRREADTNRALLTMSGHYERAFDMLTSTQARVAFDLSKEPIALRERYGQNAWGQRALMARQLVEAGCSFVTVVMENPNIPGCFYNWDTHAVNHDNFIDMKLRLPLYDKAVTALVEDLHARGLTKKVMLVVTGEFGRSPRISKADGGAKGMRSGREHWPQSMSVLVCGGGMKHGQVIGSTDKLGTHPHDNHLTPNDLWATVYKHLGIDPDTNLYDQQQRPVPILPFGEPIRELT
ncbi:MAG: DUF1501 domain-containing protein [Planctomycetes bacterium]|nr:DUF1501 domain-containing protein [Planctomycetota bacterium]